MINCTKWMNLEMWEMECESELVCLFSHLSQTIV